MLGTPQPCLDIEHALRELTGADDILTFPTITHIHMSVLPFLSGQGAIFLDCRAHKTIYDGCKVAEGRGATLQRFQHNDADSLERLLNESTTPPRVICMDGVNSMTSKVGIRVQLTAVNTPEEISHLLTMLEQGKARFHFFPAKEIQ